MRIASTSSLLVPAAGVRCSSSPAPRTWPAASDGARRRGARGWKLFALELVAVLCLAASRAPDAAALVDGRTINPNTSITIATATVRGNAFSVGTSTFVVNAGRVGVLVAAPSVPLDIQANAAADGVKLRGRNNGGVDESNFYFTRFDGTTNELIIAANGNYSAIYPAGQFRFVNPSGSASSFYFATNDFTAGGGAGSSLGVDFGAASGNTYSRVSAFSQGYNAWNNLILQSGGGNVGVGELSPGGKFSVTAAGANAPNTTYIVDHVITGGPGKIGTVRYSDNATYSAFLNFSASTFTITGPGAPSATVAINGSGDVQLGTTPHRSTFTASGYFLPPNWTLAQIQSATPAAAELGGQVTCVDCVSPYSVCQSTGSTIQGFRLGLTGTNECK